MRDREETKVEGGPTTVTMVMLRQARSKRQLIVLSRRGQPSFVRTARSSSGHRHRHRHQNVEIEIVRTVEFNGEISS